MRPREFIAGRSVGFWGGRSALFCRFYHDALDVK